MVKGIQMLSMSCTRGTLLAFLLITHHATLTLQSGTESELIEKLVKVSPFARPVRNGSSPVVVTFGYELMHIVAIVESEQTVTFLSIE